MGSAYGGTWRPKKEEDQRLLGTPGEIHVTRKPNGVVYLTKIGEDGRAVKERHLTDHNQPWAHTDPHENFIQWKLGKPDFYLQVNYPEEDYPDGVPEFKKYGEKKMVSTDDLFHDLNEFKESLYYGKEIGFRYMEQSYFVFINNDRRIFISESGKRGTEKEYATIEELLTHPIGDCPLREAVTKIEILTRNV